MCTFFLVFQLLLHIWKWLLLSLKYTKELDTMVLHPTFSLWVWLTYIHVHIKAQKYKLNIKNMDPFFEYTANLLVEQDIIKEQYKKL